MLSSLSKQLDVLRSQEQHATRTSENRPATVLFDPKEAAKMDADQIQAIALTGFHNLCQSMPSLLAHRSLMVDHHGVDRMLLTKTDDAELSGKVKAILRELSKAFLNVNCLKVLEYLLKNFQVHRHEGDFLVVSFLAFHATSQYAKLLQNIDLTSKTNRFHGLESFALTGKPVPRDFVMRMVTAEPSILESYRQFAKDCLTDSSQGTSVFVSSAIRQQPFRSPTVSFLATLIADLLASSNNPAAHRLVSLKAVRDFLFHDSDSENVNAGLFVLVALIERQLLEDSVLQVCIRDITKLADNPTYSLTLAKFILLLFQITTSITYSTEVAGLVHKLLDSIITADASVVQMLLKAASYCCDKATTEESLTDFQILLSHAVKRDSILKDSFTLERFLAVICGIALSSSNRERLLAIVQNAAGHSAWANALSKLREGSELKAEEVAEVDRLLTGSALHRLIDAGRHSKVSVAAGLLHEDAAVRLKAISLLLTAEPEQLASDNLLKLVLGAIEKEFNVEVLAVLLRYPFRALKLTDSQADLLFTKFLTIEDPAIQKAIKGVAASNSHLKTQLDVVDVLVHTSKTTSAAVLNYEVVEFTVRKMAPYLASSSKYDIKALVAVLLSQKQYSTIEKCITSLARSASLAADLFATIKLHLDTQLSALMPAEMAAALRIVGWLADTDISLNYIPSDPSTFTKMALFLLFAGEDHVDNSVLAAVSKVLSSLPDIDISEISELGQTVLLLLLKGLKDEKLKNGHFLKILQTVRFAIKKDNHPGVQLFKHLLKRLILHKFDFEAGTFNAFDEGDLKSVKDFLGQPKTGAEKFVLEFLQTGASSSNLHAEIIQFCKILSSIRFSHPSLLAQLPSIAAKVDGKSPLRQAVVRQLFDLHCSISNARSAEFERLLVSHRCLVAVPFSYLLDKRSYDHYVELAALYLEANFGRLDLVAEVKLDGAETVTLARQITAKKHAGTITALSHLLALEADRADSPSSVACLFYCYRLLVGWLVADLHARDDAHSAAVKALTAVATKLVHTDFVKLVNDRAALKGQTIIPCPGGTKDFPEIGSVDENKKTRVVLSLADLYDARTYEVLDKKACSLAAALLLLKHEQAAEGTDDESASKFNHLSAIASYLLVSNKNLKGQIAAFVRHLLEAMAQAVADIRAKLRAPATKEKGLLAAPTAGHHTLFSRLIREVDFLLLHVLSTAAAQFGAKRLKICSEILLFWLLFSEKYRDNSLFKLLANFYSGALKKGTARPNPMADPEIFYLSSFLRDVNREVFGKENTDIFLSVLVSGYIFSTTGAVDDAKKANLDFRHFSHFLSLLLIDRAASSADNSQTLVETLSGGLVAVKGLLLAASKKAAKQPKTLIIRDFLARHDPMDSSTAGQRDKVRGLRFCLIYLSLVSTTLRDKGVARYLQAAIMRHSGDFRQAPLMQALEGLLFEAFRFDADLERSEKGYQKFAKKPSPTVVAMFGKLHIACDAVAKAVSLLMPLEIYPVSILAHLSVETPDFDILLRLAESQVVRLSSGKITEEFYGLFEQSLTTFLSMEPLMQELSIKSKATRRFIQNFFAALARLHQRSHSRMESIVADRLDQLVKMSAAQSDLVTQVSCLGSLAFYSREASGPFVAVLDTFLAALERLAQTYLRAGDPKLADGIARLKEMAAVTSSKEKGKPLPVSAEVAKAWIKTNGLLISNLGSILGQSLNRMVIYLACLSRQEVTSSAALDVLEALPKTADVATVLSSLGSVMQPFAVAVLGSSRVASVASLITGSPI